jgi:hypothetical protein
MAQAHYIDIDEEITSVIDRLRKSKSTKNIFIVPQRSLVLQSIVSLKLLKREADKIKKKAVIVTQQEQGRIFAERAGIETRDSIEDVEPEEKSDVSVNEEKISRGMSIPGVSAIKKTDRRERLANLGSQDFFETKTQKAPPIRIGVSAFPVAKEETKAEPSLRNMAMNDITPQISGKVFPAAKTFEDKIRERNNFSGSQSQKIKTLFSPLPPTSSQSAKTGKDTAKKNKAKFFLVIVFVLIILAVLAVPAYFFVPKAEILIKVNYGIKDVNVALQAKEENGDNDAQGRIVPARVFEREMEITKEFDASGSENGNTAKAKGKVVIFNEFSSSPQPLVATTRFLSEEGKLFRLVSGVVVPGLTTVGGEDKPGAVEADVIADEPGEQYNIGPGTFKIPGFEGGNKYEKFYARSEKPMIGGSSGEREKKIITQSDLEMAKSRFEEEAKSQAKQELDKDLPDNFILINGSEKIEISDLKTDAKSGEQKDKFSYTGRISAQAIALSGSFVAEIIKTDAKEEYGLEKEQIILKNLEYQAVKTDFSQKNLEFKVSSQLYIIPQINTEDLKRTLLGKNEDEIKPVLNEYPSIKELEINFTPSFMTARIPRLESHVSVAVEDLSKIGEGD